MANGEWDVLGPDWGLGLPIDWFDTTQIIALLDSAQGQLLRIDQLVLGWDGEPVNAWETARTMLRARGLFVGETYEGKITFARLRMASVEDLADATTITPVPRTLKLQPGEGEGVDRIRGLVGKTPWSDGVRLEVNALSDADATRAPSSLRGAIFSDERVLELDLSVLSPAAAQADGFSLMGLLTARGFGSPMLNIKATDPDNISHGDMLRVADPGLKENWFVDADGNKLSIDSGPKWFGQVIGFRRNLRDGSIDLTLLMHNWHVDDYPRLRAPAAIVDGAPTGATYTVNVESLGSSADAETEFTLGDKVEIWKPSFGRRSGSSGSPDVQTIDSMSGNDITLDADWTISGQDGDIIRLARLNDSTGNPEDDSPKFSGFVAYAYMADAARTLGTTNIDAHIYGFGII